MMGMDSIRPFCAGLRLKVSEMKGAMAPLSTQMQHENEKYKKAANSVGAWPDFKKLRKPAMVQILGYRVKFPKTVQKTGQLGGLVAGLNSPFRG